MGETGMARKTPSPLLIADNRHWTKLRSEKMKLFKRKTMIERYPVSRFLVILETAFTLSDVLRGKQGSDWIHHELVLENLTLQRN